MHCGRYAKEIGRIGPISGICSICFACPGLAETYRCRELPTAHEICPHPPGSPEKVAWMAARVGEGFSPFSPADSTFDGARPGCTQPAQTEKFSLPVLRVKGVEKFGRYYRARPAWEGKRVSLGLYRTVEEAEAAARRFWVEQLGMWAELGGAFRHFRLRSPCPMTAKRPRQKRGKPNGPKLWEEELAMAV